MQWFWCTLLTLLPSFHLIQAHSIHFPFYLNGLFTVAPAPAADAFSISLGQIDEKSDNNIPNAQ